MKKARAAWGYCQWSIYVIGKKNESLRLVAREKLSEALLSVKDFVNSNTL